MKWITRRNVKVDRVACPWRAAAQGATPFDVPANPRIHLNHRPGECTFEAILDDYHLDDPALRRLALIVHGALPPWACRTSSASTTSSRSTMRSWPSAGKL